MAFPNQAKRFNGAYKFTRDGEGAYSIGEVLDQFTKKQGVACDGAINGIAFPYGTGDPTHRITFETIANVDTMVVRDCSGAIVFSTASGIDPQSATSTDFYRATLTGADDVDPTAVVQRNDLSAAIVWARTGEGVYTGTLAAAFTALKTNIALTLGTATAGVVLKAVHTSANVVTISTFAADGTTPADFIGTINVTITVEP